MLLSMIDLSLSCETITSFYKCFKVFLIILLTHYISFYFRILIHYLYGGLIALLLPDTIARMVSILLYQN